MAPTDPVPPERLRDTDTPGTVRVEDGANLEGAVISGTIRLAE